MFSGVSAENIKPNKLCALCASAVNINAVHLATCVIILATAISSTSFIRLSVPMVIGNIYRA